MYHYIKGIITQNKAGQVILENQGIGYEVSVSLPTSETLVEGSDTKLFIHVQVNQQDSSTRFFGFKDELEKKIYRSLIDVSGVGAATGLAILSTLTPGEIQRAIASGDANTIQRVKGVGPKAAQRLVLELRGKPEFLPTTDAGNQLEGSQLTSGVGAEALQALMALGIPKPSAKKSIDKILKDHENPSVEELIRMALKTY